MWNYKCGKIQRRKVRLKIHMIYRTTFTFWKHLKISFLFIIFSLHYSLLTWAQTDGTDFYKSCGRGSRNLWPPLQLLHKRYVSNYSTQSYLWLYDWFSSAVSLWLHHIWYIFTDSDSISLIFNWMSVYHFVANLWRP